MKVYLNKIHRDKAKNNRLIDNHVIDVKNRLCDRRITSDIEEGIFTYKHNSYWQVKLELFKQKCGSFELVISLNIKHKSWAGYDEHVPEEVYTEIIPSLTVQRKLKIKKLNLC